MRYLLFCLLVAAAVPGFGAEKLRILLTNDDGYDAPGLAAVHEALVNDGHDVYVIAPATQQSGASAAITSGGVRVTPHPGQVWAVDGRPADAVRVGLGNIMYNNPPDLVVAGANFGQNTGQDVNISGTVGAAVTAFNLGVPAIAISVGIRLEEADRGFPSTFGAFSGAARLLARLVYNIDLADMEAVLNVNYPAALPLDVRGVRWTELSSHSLIGKRYNQKSDGRYAPEFQAPGRSSRARDAESLDEGFVTLTFLDGDMSVPVRRGQRYMDQQLLDSAFTPAPARTSRPATQPVRTEPPAPAAKPTSLRESKPAQPAINLEVPPVESTAEPAEQEAEAEPERSREQPKKKPDSWLRRMFDPSSWLR